jgi:polyhydroxybutyrate depolymerase
MSFHARYRSNGWIRSSGEQREYSLFVPRSYDPRTPVPLVISLPGAGLWGAAQEDISRWDEIAERERFIVAYPTGGKGGPRAFHVEETAGLARDVRFITDLIATLRAAYNIDERRVYANGLSIGAGMSFVLSCTMRDRIAAVGMVSGAQLLRFDWCPDPRPVPMIAFHGTADPVAPYAGGRTWVAPVPFPNMTTWVANWARRNRCAPDPIDARVSANVTRRTYRSCEDNASVEFYTIADGGHDWPGGGGALPRWLCGPVSRGVDATTVMWEFLKAHPLR